MRSANGSNSIGAPAIPLPSRNELVAAIAKALNGEEAEDGLVTFEILSGSTNFFEVIVVWPRWAEIPADIRSKIVVEAYAQLSSAIPTLWRRPVINSSPGHARRSNRDGCASLLSSVQCPSK